MNISTSRLENFSDGVISIVITIMIFSIKFPDLHHEATQRDVWVAMAAVAPKLIAYAFSFLVLGVLWLNHHHLFHLVQIADERLLWLNLNLLFWMSLIPFPTSMIGANPMLSESAAVFGIVLLMTSVSFSLLRSHVLRKHLTQQDNARLDRKVEKVTRNVLKKSWMGVACYAAGIPLAFVSVYISFVLFLLPTLLFFMPDGVPEAGIEAGDTEKK